MASLSASLYGMACIAVWLSPAACTFLSYRRKLARQYPTRYFLFLGVLAVWMLFMGLNLSFDSPRVFSFAMLLELLLLIPFVGGKASCLTNRGIRIGIYGTIILTGAFYFVADMDGNIGSREGRLYYWRAQRNTVIRDRAFNARLRELAKDDDTDYPPGALNAGHPLVLKHPALAATPLTVGTAAYWHSFFTGIKRRQTAPPRHYPGGRLSENIPDIEKLWEALIGREDSLNFGYDAFGVSSVFEEARSAEGRILWDEFAGADEYKNLMAFLAARLGEVRESGIDICFFGKAAEGQMALFAMQRLSGRNFDEYNGDNLFIHQVLRRSRLGQRILYLEPLREILADEEGRGALGEFLMKRR